MQSLRSLRSRLLRVCHVVVLFATIAAMGFMPSNVRAQEPEVVQPAADATLQETPTTLVSENVSSFTIRSSKVIWFNRPSCSPTSAGTQDANPQDVNASQEEISRVATYGSNFRTLYRNVFASSFCGQQNITIRSNVVADSAYAYWSGPQGIKRISQNANVGDIPETVSTGGVNAYQLIMGKNDAEIYATAYNFQTQVSSVVAISTTLNSTPRPIIAVAGTTERPYFDGTYLYWLRSPTSQGGNQLERIDPKTGDVRLITTGVGAYYPEGPRRFLTCNINFQCDFTTTQFVFYSKGNKIFRYNATDGSTLANPVYTSTTSNASIQDIVTTATAFGTGSIFLFEARPIPCSPQPCFSSVNNVLLRSGRGNDTNKAILYTSDATFQSGGGFNLAVADQFVFWTDGSLKRLAQNAAALPVINLKITSIEITQGIQDLLNTVPSIRRKRTFVRVHVKSDGASVPNVTARLSARWVGAPSYNPDLVPVNTTGTKITVQSSPSRDNIDHAFLFELPWNWTSQSVPVTFVATINPNHYPLEPDFGDNTRSISRSFRASPRLPVQIVAFGYSLNGNIYYPRAIKDIEQTFSWIRRTYPVASGTGGMGDPTPGFRPRLWYVYSSGLGSRVNQTASECDDNLCASAYTNNLMTDMRSWYGIPNSVFMYGMISDAAGIFPRGQAWGSYSSGPTGSGNWGWDFDGSYADWYAGHEIGHTLGRAHPTPSAASCGNSASDNSYPYPGARISSLDGRFYGFDTGDSGLSLPKRVYPGTSWYDLMSYCSNQWISDYTYKGMLSYMDAHPADADGYLGEAAPRVSGDFLSIHGVINPVTNEAHANILQRLSEIASIPPRDEQGAYRLQLLNISGTLLADYAFSPVALEDNGPAPTADPPVSNLMTFGEVVPFVGGTNQIRILRPADNVVLGRWDVSTHAPTISNVRVLNVPDKGGLSGDAQLAWDASDVDGDTLSYDVFYSRDNGATFQPVQLLVPTSTLSIDTSTLGGSGEAIFRVHVNDGVNTAFADSASFFMARKAPTVKIVTPENNTHLLYEQVLNLEGQYSDLQDDNIPDTNVVWTASYSGTVGFGPLATLNNLPAGPVDVTLTVTNTAGLASSDTVHIVVDDDLSPPPAQLSVAPTSIGWHVVSGTTDLQTQIVDVSNIGEGTLTWFASTSVPWLSLSAVTGAAPGTFTLTAHPNGITNGMTLSSTLVVTATGGTGIQRIEIPVSLSAGNLQDTFGDNGTPVDTRRHIFLSMVRR